MPRLLRIVPLFIALITSIAAAAAHGQRAAASAPPLRRTYVDREGGIRWTDDRQAIDLRTTSAGQSPYRCRSQGAAPYCQGNESLAPEESVAGSGA